MKNHANFFFFHSGMPSCASPIFFMIPCHLVKFFTLHRYIMLGKRTCPYLILRAAKMLDVTNRLSLFETATLSRIVWKKTSLPSSRMTLHVQITENALWLLSYTPPRIQGTSCRTWDILWFRAPNLHRTTRRNNAGWCRRCGGVVCKKMGTRSVNHRTGLQCAMG